MSESLNKIRKTTGKILTYGKAKIMEDFWPFSDDISKFKRSFGLKNDPKDQFYAETLSLYSLMFSTNLLTDHLHSLMPLPQWDESVINSLRQKPKYQKMTQEEFESVIVDAVYNDVRNCFAHGNFAAIYEQKIFVLVPNQSLIQSDDYTIILPYESVFMSLAKIIDDKNKTIRNKESFEKAKTENFDNFVKEYMVPNLLFYLANFYHTEKKDEKFTKACKQVSTSVLLQYLFNSTIAVFNQNACYQKFGKDSEIFKDLSFVRHSTAHNATSFAEKGSSVVLTNPGAKNASTKQYKITDLALDLDIYNSQIDGKDALSQGLNDIKNGKTK